MNKKGKEKMEDAASGSFSMNKFIFPDKYEASSSLDQMNDAASILLHMKRQHLDSRTANHLQELIDKNNQTWAPPPEVRASFPIESLPHLVGEYSSCLQKQLTLSDIKDNQMRLMFPKSFVEKHINPLLKDGESPSTGIPIDLYFLNPKTMQDGIYHMFYKCWRKTYVLTSGWLPFVSKCNLKQGDVIKLWAFRHSESGYLRFAVTLRLPDDDR